MAHEEPDAKSIHELVQAADEQPAEVATQTETLVAGLSHDDQDVRLAATYALGRVAYERPEAVRSAVPALAGRLTDVHEIRTNAATALANVALEYPDDVGEVLDALRAVFDDDRPEARGEAARAVAAVAAAEPRTVPKPSVLIDELQELRNDDNLGDDVHQAIMDAIEALTQEAEEPSPGDGTSIWETDPPEDATTEVSDSTQAEIDGETQAGAGEEQASLDGTSVWETDPPEGMTTDTGGSAQSDSEEDVSPTTPPQIDESTDSTHESSATPAESAPDSRETNRPTPKHGRRTEATDTQPSDADLAPIPDNAPSLPIRVLVHLIFWPVYVFTIFPFQFAWRFAKIGHVASQMRPADAIHIYGGTIIFSAMTSWKRFVLYLRRSWLLTPGTTIPFMPGGRVPRTHPQNNQPEYPANWDEICRQVYERDGYQCRNCGAGGGPKGDTELHIDHRKPRSAGGEDHLRNLRTLCKICHEIRHRRRFD